MQRRLHPYITVTYRVTSPEPGERRGLTASQSSGHGAGSLIEELDQRRAVARVEHHVESLRKGAFSASGALAVQPVSATRRSGRFALFGFERAHAPPDLAVGIISNGASVQDYHRARSGWLTGACPSDMRSRASRSESSLFIWHPDVQM